MKFSKDKGSTLFHQCAICHKKFSSEKTFLNHTRNKYKCHTKLIEQKKLACQTRDDLYQRLLDKLIQIEAKMIKI